MEYEVGKGVVGSEVNTKVSKMNKEAKMDLRTTIATAADVLGYFFSIRMSSSTHDENGAIPGKTCPHKGVASTECSFLEDFHQFVKNTRNGESD